MDTPCISRGAPRTQGAAHGRHPRVWARRVGQHLYVIHSRNLVTRQSFSQLRRTRSAQRARLDFKLDLSYLLPCHVTNQEHFTVTIKEGWHHSKELQFMRDDDWHSKDSPPLVNCCFFTRRCINLQTSAQIFPLLLIFSPFFFFPHNPTRIHYKAPPCPSTLNQAG